MTPPRRMRTFKPRESSFQAKAIKYLKKNGAVVVNYNPGLFGRKGVSDLIVCYRGLFLAPECKRPGEDATEAQEDFLREVEKAGGVASVVRTLEDVEDMLEEARARIGDE